MTTHRLRAILTRCPSLLKSHPKGLGESRRNRLRTDPEQLYPCTSTHGSSCLQVTHPKVGIDSRIRANSPLAPLILDRGLALSVPEMNIYDERLDVAITHIVYTSGGASGDLCFSTGTTTLAAPTSKKSLIATLKLAVSHSCHLLM